MLDKQYAVSEICPARQWHQIESLHPEEVSKYKAFRGHFNLGNLFALPEAPFSITLIRDPVERVISEYHQWHDGAPVLRPNPYHAISQLAQSCSLIEFARRDAESGFFVNNRQTHQLALLRSMPRPSVDLTPEQVWEKAIENLEKFSLVGTTDTIEQTIEILCFHYGWMPPAQVPSLRSREKKAEVEVSASVREELAELNQLDLRLYERARELLELHYKKIAAELGVVWSFDNPDSHQAMQTLLHQRYETAYKSRHPVLHKELSLGFEQAIDGDGWYPRENDPEQKQTWRWTGPGTVSTLDLPLDPSQSLRVEFDIVKTADPALIKTVNIKVNGILLPHAMQEKDGGVHTCSFNVPVDVLEKSPEQARISIEVQKTTMISDGIPRSQSFIFAGLAISEFRVVPR